MRWLTIEKLVLALCLALIAFILFASTKTNAAAPPVTPIQSGGTATGTLPAYGNVLVGGKNGEYEFAATSTFGAAASPVQSVFGRTGAITAQSGDYTTLQITESGNLYFTNARAVTALTGQNVSIFTNDAGYLTQATFNTAFDNRITATTSLPSITTLSHLSLPYSQLTGAPTIYPYPFPAGATSTNITFSGGLTGTLTGSITGNAATVTNGVYTTTFNTLFDNRLSASTSIAGITTLPNLSLPYSQLTGAPGASASFSTTSAAYWITSTTSLPSIVTLANLSLPYAQLAGKPVIASSTLLGDTNTFSGADSFTNAASNFSGTWQTFNPAHFLTSAVTAVTASFPIASSGGNTPNITFGGLGTSTNLTQGQLPYNTGVNSFGQVATTSVTCTGNATCTSFTAIGPSPITINVAAGTAASSTLLGDANTFSGVDKFTNASSDFSGTWQTFSPAHFQVAGSYLTAAITALGPLGQTQTGPTQTLATSSATTINGLTVGLTIVGSGNTQTFTPNFSGSISGLSIANFASASLGQFFSTTSADYHLSATTTLPRITTLPGLSLPYSQLTGTPAIASSTLLGDTNTFNGTDKFNNTIQGSINGNANTATTLATPRAINTVNFDGSAPITIFAASSTLLADFNTFTHIITGSISGNAGTVTNGVYTTDSGTVTNTMLAGSIANAKLVNSSIVINGTTFNLGDNKTINAASSTLLSDFNTFAHTITGSITGNAGTATAFQTGRTLSITGDLAYTSPTFDGSGNVTAAGTLATVNSNIGSFTNANITINGKGLVTAASNGTASFAFPWIANAASIFFGQVSNSTSTEIHFGGSPFALTASSTSVFANATSSLATILSGLWLGANAEITSFTGTGLSISGGALGLSTPVSLANGGTAATSLGAGLTNASSVLKQVENRGFSITGTTTSATTGLPVALQGTTTVQLGVGYGEIWNTMKCYTDVGTVNVDFQHASTHFTFFNASTTIGTVNMNATVDTTGDKVSVSIGTPASSPTTVACTVNDTI